MEGRVGSDPRCWEAYLDLLSRRITLDSPLTLCNLHPTYRLLQRICIWREHNGGVGFPEDSAVAADIRIVLVTEPGPFFFLPGILAKQWGKGGGGSLLIDLQKPSSQIQCFVLYLALLPRIWWSKKQNYLACENCLVFFLHDCNQETSVVWLKLDSDLSQFFQQVFSKVLIPCQPCEML